MGLLGRIGKEWGKQAANGGSRVRDYLGGPPMMAGIGGAAIGGPAAAFAAADGGDPMAAAGQYGGMGAAMMGGFGAVASGTMGMKQLIIAIAKAMKQKMPEAADNEIIMNAQRVVQDAMGRPDARAQLEKILGKMNWDQ